MSEKDRFADLKKINIVEFCSENDIPLVRDSNEYYRLEEYDSCVISAKKNKFTWNSRSVSGGTIEFVKNYYDTSFQQACRILTEREYKPHEYIPREEKDFIYDDTKESDNQLSAKNYLINSRKIDWKIVNKLVKDGSIRESKNGNVLFIWKDGEKVVGCTEQGTDSSYNLEKEKTRSFKKIQLDSKKDFGFNIKIGKPENIYFFESEIDMLSYMSLHPQKMENAHFVSMNGLKKETVMNVVNRDYAETKELPKSIINCVDNDTAGNKFHDTNFKDQSIGNHKTGEYIEFKSHLPEKDGYDWNDVKKNRVIDNVKSIVDKGLLSKVLPQPEKKVQEIEMS